MKLGDLDNTTEGRLFINTKLIPQLVKRLKNGNRVLFVGTDTAWDYKPYFFNPGLLCEYLTIDKAPQYHPDIVGSIEGCNELKDEYFDLVVLIGIYEFVDNKKAMFSEIVRVLKPTGAALLSLPGRGYYTSPNNSVELWELDGAIKPLLVKEVYVVGETKERRPTSIHVIAQK